jgi:hypothetical protein
MNRRLLIKTLALSIVFLFIGVSLSSAISVDTKSPIFNNQSEECKDCNEVIDADLILSKVIFKMVRTTVNRIEFLFGNYPEVADICNNITQTLDVRNPILCEIFSNLFIYLLSLADLIDYFYGDSPLGQALSATVALSAFYVLLYVAIFCEEV